MARALIVIGLALGLGTPAGGAPIAGGASSELRLTRPDEPARPIEAARGVGPARAIAAPPSLRPLRVRSGTSRGPEVSPATVILWGHLGCLPCVRALPGLREVEERLPGAVRVVWKHLAGREADRPAAEIAAAAAAQGGLFALWEQAAQKPFFGRPSRSDLLALCLLAGLDVPRIERDLAAGTFRAVVDEDQAEAAAAAVTVPGSVQIGPWVLPPPIRPDRLDELLRQALAVGVLARLRSPVPPPPF